MLVCIAGKNDIAVNVLEYVLEHFKKDDIRIVCILNKTETGVNSWQKSLKWYCEKYHIDIVKLEDVYNEDEMLFLSLEFDQIVKPNLFKSKKLYNIHFSKLPQYKGMYTSIFPIYNGEIETGVTLHCIDSGIDTGDIISQESILINDEDTAYDIYKKYIEKGTELVIKNIESLLCKKEIKTFKQDHRNSTYYSKQSIDFSKVILNCKATAWQIKRQVKAFCFRPYQLIEYQGIRIFDVEVLGEKSIYKPGTVIEENKSWIKMATIDYDILLYKDEFEDLLQCIAEFNNSEAKRILSVKKYMFEKNKYGWTALMVAVYNNNKEMFYYLLENGADINEKNWNGTNMLMYAKDCYKIYSDYELFEYLYDLGLSVFEKDFNDKSLVDYCEIEGIKSIGKVKIV